MFVYVNTNTKQKIDKIRVQDKIIEREIEHFFCYCIKS